MKKLNDTEKKCWSKKAFPCPVTCLSPSPSFQHAQLSICPELPCISTDFLIAWVISHRHHVLTWPTNEDLAHSHIPSLFFYLSPVLVTLNNKALSLSVSIMDSFFLTLILSLTITDVLFSKVKMEDKKKKNWILCEIQVLSAKNYDVGAPTVRSYGQMAKLFCFPTEYPQACRIMSVISWSFTVLYSPGHGCKTHKQPSCLITMLESWF